jgi:hypothetical protein
MRGLHILARTLTRPVAMGASGRKWQYHPRSDRHSQVACWAILFDLLQTCPLLAQQAQEGKILFGINHEMRDFRMNRKKSLDLVVSTVGSGSSKRKVVRFADLVRVNGIDLDREEMAILRGLPDLHSGPVGSVHLALEAKACMTEHMKARPRLYDELNSSHQTVHGASDTCIAAGFVMVNLARRFRSPTRKEAIEHDQPRVTEEVIEKVKELPRRTTRNDEGYDALAIAVVDCANDAVTPFRLVETPPAPSPDDIFHYDQMIRRVAQAYEARFSGI